LDINILLKYEDNTLVFTVLTLVNCVCGVTLRPAFFRAAILEEMSETWGGGKQIKAGGYENDRICIVYSKALQKTAM